MIEIEVNKENLEEFIKNIRKEDKEELEYILKDNWIEDFINTCLNEKNIWFLADYAKKPCAIGGIQFEPKEKTGIKKGRIWLLCANNVSKNRIFLFRYVKNKIKSFKKQADILYNRIYKSNFHFLKSLKNCGFKAIDIDDNNKIFYYIKEENFDT